MHTDWLTRAFRNARQAERSRSGRSSAVDQTRRSSIALRPPASLTLALLLALGWLVVCFAASQAAPLRQETPTPSPSHSPTPSLSPTQSLTTTLPTATATLSVTHTASPSASPSAGPSVTPSATLPVPPVASPTWTFPAPPIASPTLPILPVTPGPTGEAPVVVGPTATLLPLPTVTYQYPQLNPTSPLLALAQPTAVQVLSKGGPSLVERIKPGPGWLLFFLVVLWGGLIAWYVVAQIIAHRR